MIFTISSQPYYSFEKEQSFGIDFDRILIEAQNFMIASDNHFPTCNFGLKPQSQTLRPEDLVISAEDTLRMSGLSAAQAMRYKKIVKGLYCPWTCYPLNEFRHWDTRQDKRETWYADALKYMPYFIGAIQSIAIMKNIGWVRIYANEAFNAVEMHRDYSPDIAVDQFLYFNLSDKQTFIFDSESSTKHYLNSKLIFFDAANIHGTDPESKFNFSIRVDGRFTDHFLAELEFSRMGARESQVNP